MTTSVENQIKRLEEDWAQAMVKYGTSAVDRYEADDIITTDPDGRVTDKAQDKKDMRLG
jgi:ketosteroid isomerase-like protein